MVKRHGIDVNVTDENSNAFIEYGLQSDHRFKKDRSQVSTFIEAKSEARFLIRVTVDNPFRFEEGVDPIARLAASVTHGKPSLQVRNEHNTRTKHFDDNCPVEEKVQGFANAGPIISKAPFDLMVAIFIDGRAKPECRQMIYLDPEHPRYGSPCVLKGRWVAPGDKSERDGKAGLLQWVFTDRGIEHLLGHLNVKKPVDKASSDPLKSELEAICDSMGEDLLEDPENKRMKAGTIEVRFRRVVVVESDTVDQKFRAYHYAGSDEKPREIDDDCTHTTSFLPKASSGGPQKIETFALRQVGWNHYKKGEDFWATVIFKYTARHKLVNLNLSDPDGKPTLLARISKPELGPTSRRGKKRAFSVGDDEADEQRWPGDRMMNKPSEKRKEAQLGRESEDSEEDPSETAAFLSVQRQPGRSENYKKAKVEDEVDQTS